MAFKLRSGNTVPFKSMGSKPSPMKEQEFHSEEDYDAAQAQELQAAQDAGIDMNADTSSATQSSTLAGLGGKFGRGAEKHSAEALSTLLSEREKMLGGTTPRNLNTAKKRLEDYKEITRDSMKSREHEELGSQPIAGEKFLGEDDTPTLESIAEENER